MSKKKQKVDTSPILITLSIDPALKMLPDGQRAMTTTFTARRGDVAQLRQVDVTNWKHDIPATIDDLVRLMMGGLELPAFPNMADIKASGEAAAKDTDQEEESEETDASGEELEPAAEAEVLDEQLVEDQPLEPEEVSGFADGAHEDAYDQDNGEPVTAEQPELL